MIVVEDMDIMPPRKMQLMKFMSSSFPTPKPASTIPVMIIRAVTMAELPDRNSFLNENSSPSVNISTTIPRSAQKSMFSRLEIEGR